MAKKPQDRSLGDGVCFAEQDYIGSWKRLVILIVDGITLFVLLVIALAVLEAAPEKFSKNILTIANFGMIWLYLVPLKRSRFRTIGYRLVSAKIVTYQGKPPSLFTVTFREAMWLLGLTNLLFDIGWCSMDERKQAFRDRMLQLYVVKNCATPIGDGEIHLSYYCAFCHFYTLPKVYGPPLPLNPSH